MTAHAPVDDPAREASPAPAMQWRKVAFFLLRVGLSVGLLWLVAYRVSFEDLGRRLGTASPAWLALAVALLCAVTVASAVRWQRVASVVCPGVRWAPIWRVLMISTFFDQLIFNMSGDAFRVWFMNRMAPSITHAVSGVLLDRVVGFFALVALIVATLPFLVTLESAGALIAAPLLLSAGCLAGVVLVLLFDSIPLPAFPLKESIRLLSRIARSLVARSRTLFAAVGAAILVHLGVTMAFAAIGMGVGLTISPGWYVMLVPTVMLISLLPVSIGGWGVREGAMVVGFGLAGVGDADALLVSLLFGAIVTSVGLLGGLLLLFHSTEVEAYQKRETTHANR